MIHGTPVFKPTAILAAQFAYDLAPDPITDSIGPYSFSIYQEFIKKNTALINIQLSQWVISWEENKILHMWFEKLYLG